MDTQYTLQIIMSKCWSSPAVDCHLHADLCCLCCRSNGPLSSLQVSCLPVCLPASSCLPLHSATLFRQNPDQIARSHRHHSHTACRECSVSPLCWCPPLWEAAACYRPMSPQETCMSMSANCRLTVRSNSYWPAFWWWQERPASWALCWWHRTVHRRRCLKSPLWTTCKTTVHKQAQLQQIRHCSHPSRGRIFWALIVMFLLAKIAALIARVLYALVYFQGKTIIVYIKAQRFNGAVFSPSIALPVVALSATALQLTCALYLKILDKLDILSQLDNSNIIWVKGTMPP